MNAFQVNASWCDWYDRRFFTISLGFLFGFLPRHEFDFLNTFWNTHKNPRPNDKTNLFFSFLEFSFMVRNQSLNVLICISMLWIGNLPIKMCCFNQKKTKFNPRYSKFQLKKCARFWLKVHNENKIDSLHLLFTYIWNYLYSLRDLSDFIQEFCHHQCAINLRLFCYSLTLLHKAPNS